LGVLVDEVDDFPDEESLQAALSAVESLEATSRLTSSLRAKLTGEAAVLVEELLGHGEVAVTSNAQRQVTEDLFARSRVLAQTQGREAPDGRGFFDALPLAKEFVLLYQPPSDGPGGATAGRSGEMAVNAGAGAGAVVTPAGERWIVGTAATKRMYVEVKEHHMRVAVARGFSIA